MAKEATRVRRRERKNIVSGVAHVNASFNNTMITITDAQGNTISWSSSGSMGFKGSRKSTPYAAQMAAEDAGRKAQEHGVRTLDSVHCFLDHCRVARRDAPVAIEVVHATARIVVQENIGGVAVHVPAECGTARGVAAGLIVAGSAEPTHDDDSRRRVSHRLELG